MSLNTKRAIVLGCSLLLVPIILVADLALKLSGWPTISQSIIWATSFSPLVPWLFGVGMGMLAMHLWEKYFLMEKKRWAEKGWNAAMARFVDHISFETWWEEENL